MYLLGICLPISYPMVTLFPSFAYLAWYTWYTSSSIPLGCYISLQFFVKGFFQPSTGRKISSGVSQNVRREYIYTLGKTCNLRAMFPFDPCRSLRNGAGYHWHLHFGKSLRYLLEIFWFKFWSWNTEIESGPCFGQDKCIYYVVSSSFNTCFC